MNFTRNISVWLWIVHHPKRDIALTKITAVWRIIVLAERSMKIVVIVVVVVLLAGHAATHWTTIKLNRVMLIAKRLLGSIDTRVKRPQTSPIGWTVRTQWRRQFTSHLSYDSCQFTGCRSRDSSSASPGRRSGRRSTTVSAWVPFAQHTWRQFRQFTIVQDAPVAELHVPRENRTTLKVAPMKSAVELLSVGAVQTRSGSRSRRITSGKIDYQQTGEDGTMRADLKQKHSISLIFIYE